MSDRWARVTRRVTETCAGGLDPRALRVEVLVELARVVPFDAYAWVLTDPASCVGVAPLAQVPSLEELPRLIRAKYATDVNRWTQLPPDRALTLRQATHGVPERSRWWREVLAEYGVTDVVSMVFRDNYGCWAFLDLWRIATRTVDSRSDMPPRFSAREVDFLSDLLPVLCRALRDAIAATFQSPPSTDSALKGGPIMLMLGEDLRLLAQTPQTDAYLRTLLPPGEQVNPVPAAAYNVAAQLLAYEDGLDPHPPTGRVHLTSNRWLTLRAARLSPADTIAVTLENSTPTDRADLFAAAHALTPRETQLLLLLLTGLDTRHLARRMALSEHTVQDHLKSIFSKTATASRAALVARIHGS